MKCFQIVLKYIDSYFYKPEELYKALKSGAQRANDESKMYEYWHVIGLLQVNPEISSMRKAEFNQFTQRIEELYVGFSQ